LVQSPCRRPGTGARLGHPDRLAKYPSIRSTQGSVHQRTFRHRGTCSEEPLEIIEDKAQIARIAARLLPADEEDADEDDPSDRPLLGKDKEIRRLQVRTVVVADYEEFIIGSTHHTWRSDLTLLVARAPDESNCFAPLELDWDNNWSAWTWACTALVRKASSETAATDALLEHCARGLLKHGKGGYQAFLKSLVPGRG
jgi:hypothetical protein